MPKACTVGFVKRFELILRALVPDELMTWEQHGFVLSFQQQPRRLAAEHVDNHRPRHSRDGAGAPVQTVQLHDAVARRAAIVDDDVGDVDQLLAGGMGRLGLLAMGAGNDGDDRKPPLLRAPRHFHWDGPDSTGGNDDERIIRTKVEAIQNLIGIALVFFQMERRAKAICADDSGMIREGLFYQSDESHEAALTRGHLFAHHAGMSATEEKHQSTFRDAFSKQARSLLNRAHLGCFYMIE